MEPTLEALNALVADEVIGNYAVGGAVAASYYVEPTLTHDLDVFVHLPLQGGLVDFMPLVQALRARGYPAQGESFLIAGWPVQFLPAFNPLTDEALAQARKVIFGATPTSVLTAPHLAAIMLQTGRPKDRDRLRAFAEAGLLDSEDFASILRRHGLTEKWAEFKPLRQ